jgi:hypothetical protein
MSGPHRYRRRSKPILTRLEAEYLRAIYEAFWQHNYDRHGNSWAAKGAASDVLDGWAVPSEVREMIKKGLLERIPSERCDWHELAGESVRCTWHLTDYSLLLFRRWRMMELVR